MDHDFAAEDPPLDGGLDADGTVAPGVGAHGGEVFDVAGDEARYEGLLGTDPGAKGVAQALAGTDQIIHDTNQVLADAKEYAAEHPYHGTSGAAWIAAQEGLLDAQRISASVGKQMADASGQNAAWDVAGQHAGDYFVDNESDPYATYAQDLYEHNKADFDPFSDD